MLVTLDDDFYIELKGQDLGKGLEQIMETIEVVEKSSRRRRTAYVICLKSPKMDTSIQKKKKILKKNILVT